MKIYLDNCCFNRPFDDQSQIKIRIEAECVLSILQKIKEKEYILVWSYILDYENNFNPFPERKKSVKYWKDYSYLYVSETINLLNTAEELNKLGLKSKDSLHFASAIEGGCDYFITTDEKIIS